MTSKKIHQLGIRLTEDEWQRIQTVTEKAKERTYGLAEVSHVVKELMGLAPAHILTDIEISNFRKGKALEPDPGKARASGQRRP